MSENGGDDVVIRYGVKELLALQGKTLERIEAKVDQSALSQAEALGKLDTRVSLLEALNVGERLGSLEGSESEGTGRRNFGAFLLPSVLTAIFIIVSVLGLVLHG